MAVTTSTRPDGVVSSESESLILVDPLDREIGELSKAACHDGDGVLHRAFSLFVFNRAGELLLQKRSAQKRLWPLYWSNSCCSHPRSGETVDEAAHRRLEQELGLRANLYFLYKFQYRAHFGELGSENELCWVYIGVSDDPVRVNDQEIADWRFVAPDELDRELARSPEAFTPWSRMEWARLRQDHQEALRALDGDA